MTIIERNVVGGPRRARRGFAARWRRWCAEGDIRAAAFQLERMSDAQLRDIGILRDDIRQRVRQGRFG